MSFLLKDFDFIPNYVGIYTYNIIKNWNIAILDFYFVKWNEYKNYDIKYTHFIMGIDKNKEEWLLYT